MAVMYCSGEFLFDGCNRVSLSRSAPLPTDPPEGVELFVLFRIPRPWISSLQPPASLARYTWPMKRQADARRVCFKYMLVEI